MTENATDRDATCLVWYDGDVDAVLQSPTLLTTAHWDDLVGNATDEFNRIERLLEEDPTRTDISEPLSNAYGNGVVSLLLHHHPELRRVPFAETECP